jgi:hypothetical protein
MLVHVYSEEDGEALRLNFEAAPKIGDQVELDGILYKVKNAWHRPHEEWWEPKIAVALTRTSTPDAQPVLEASLG